MSPKGAVDLRWHSDGRTNDGFLGHPANSHAWKEFDRNSPSFALDPRNVRLGFASDGFNSFGSRNSRYTTWPVLLLPYNLSPWLCLRKPNILLSLIIPEY